jgi:amylosucrase
MHRPQMDWNIAARRTQPGTVEQRVFDGFRRMIDVRRSLPQLSTGGETFLHRYDDPAILAVERRHPRHGRCFLLANVAPRAASIPPGAFGWAGITNPRVALGEADVVRSAERIELAPYAIAWVVERG